MIVDEEILPTVKTGASGTLVNSEIDNSLLAVEPSASVTTAANFLVTAESFGVPDINPELLIDRPSGMDALPPVTDHAYVVTPPVATNCCE